MLLGSTKKSGEDLAREYLAKMRKDFKNLSDKELDKFIKYLAEALDIKNR